MPFLALLSKLLHIKYMTIIVFKVIFDFVFLKLPIEQVICLIMF